MIMKDFNCVSGKVLSLGQILIVKHGGKDTILCMCKIEFVYWC